MNHVTVNGVGIDVSKGRSTVAIVRPFDDVVQTPFVVHHTRKEIQDLINMIKSLDGETRIVMECTGHYYEPIARALADAGLFVAAVNPKVINQYQGDENPLRHVKTDKADAKKIAGYAIDKWTKLRQYTHEDDVRSQLKAMNRQFDFYMKQKTAIKNNLISVLDMTFPGVNNFFTSPARPDGSQKWVDFAATYWHADCVCKKSLHAFVEHYRNWCSRNQYNFDRAKAEEIYASACELIPVYPKDKITKLIVENAINQLRAISRTVENLRTLMNETAATLPEYSTVMDMTGVGTSLGPELMAELGDVTRFAHKGSVAAFAGVDPGKDDSGDKNRRSVPTTKNGSSTLRKTLFQVMDVLIRTKPQDDPVYQFMDRKRAEGKPYYVYMTAGANKFLRIYYGKVKAYMAKLEQEFSNSQSVASSPPGGRNCSVRQPCAVA